MTNDNARAEDGEIHNILAARYPNDRRLQRALIRLRELRPDAQYTSMLDTADPAFQRIVPTTPVDENHKAEPLALKAEPLIVASEANAGPKATESKEAQRKAASTSMSATPDSKKST